MTVNFLNILIETAETDIKKLQISFSYVEPRDTTLQ